MDIPPPQPPSDDQPQPPQDVRPQPEDQPQPDDQPQPEDRPQLEDRPRPPEDVRPQSEGGKPSLVKPAGPVAPEPAVPAPEPAVPAPAAPAPDLAAPDLVPAGPAAAEPASDLPSYPRPEAGPQAPYGQAPYGQPPYGQVPYGQAPYGRPPFPPPPPHGQAPYDEPPYGQGPYPPPPYQQYWYPPPPPASMNGMAITSFVLAVSCIPVFGVVFGIVALSQIRKRGQQGRALAIAGIAVSGVATLCLALMITLGAAGLLDSGTRTDDLRTGECFNLHGDSLSESSGESRGVDVVPCSEEHDAETFGVTNLSGTSGAYPGDDEVQTMADSKCNVLAEDYLEGSDRSVDSLSIYYSLPRKSGWSHGDRRVTCFFGDGGRKMTGSVKTAPGDPGTSA